MSKAYVGDQVEIESSSDTVEQVKAALGAAVEIDESPTEETETEKKPPVKEEAEEAESEEGETETEEEEAEEEEAEAEEEKPKKKAPPTHVPLSRLNEEIRRRKTLERQLAEKDSEPEPEVTAVAEVRPQNYSGKPEPKIEDFQSDPVKYPDPYASLIKEHGAWTREEARAEMAFEQRRDAFVAKREEETKLFKESLKVTTALRPDWDSVMKANKDVGVNTEAQAFMEESAIGSYMLLYLVEHQDELNEINSMRKRQRDAAMTELETALLAEVAELQGEEVVEAEKPGVKKVTPPPKKKLISQTPPPANRLKPAGPGPKSLQDLAGPVDKQGIDIEFNPEYERQAKARKRI